MIITEEEFQNMKSPIDEDQFVGVMIKHIATIKESQDHKYTKEINLMRWGKLENALFPLIDIRSWEVNKRGEKIPGKGITLSRSEMQDVIKELSNIENNKELKRMLK